MAERGAAVCLACRDQAMAAKLGSREDVFSDGPAAQLAAAASYTTLQRRAAHHGLMSGLFNYRALGI